MDDFFYSLPIGFGALFQTDPDLKNYFFSLPDETQRALIREDIHSCDDLRDCMDQYRQKE